MIKHRRYNGFTVVELLVTIIVISILAGVTIVSYTKLSEDAKTTQRISDIANIKKALELYKTKHRTYPPSGDYYIDSRSSSFLSALEPYLGTKVPVDPVNDGKNHYRYWRWEAYDAGFGYCTNAMGKFYLLEVVTETANSRLIAQSPTTGCGGAPYSLGGNNGYVSYTTSTHDN